MHKPQRQSSIGKRESLHGVYRRSGSIASKSTPLLRNRPSTRQPLSSVKTNQRESYIGTSNQHAIKDPRPLQDKSYMKKCVFDIVQLLNSLNYPSTITPKMFNPPPNKDYQRVFEFLAFEVMGNFRIIGKPEEEMLRALKDLSYPYNITKSSLSNVGAMSCWPTALGAMTWLANLAKYCRGLDDAIDETLCLNARKKLKQDFHSQCYSEFMSGKDGPFTEVASQLKAAIDEFDVDAIKSLDKLKHEYNKLSAEYETKIQEKEICLNLVDEIETKRGNIEKMRVYLSQCDEYISAMKNREKEVEASIAAKTEEIELANQTLVQLKSQVAQQEMSHADIEQVVREKQQLRDSIKASAERLEQLKATKWDLDIQIGKLTLKADELATTFNNEFKTVSNSLAHIKDHLPADLIATLQSSDFSLALGHKGLENESLLENKIQPFQTALNSRMLEVLKNLESEYYNVRKRVKQDEEVLSDMKKEKEQLQDQYQKLLKESQMQKEEFQRAEEANNAKISKAETNLEQLKSAQSESMDELETKFDQLKSNGKRAVVDHEKLEATKNAALKRTAAAVLQFQTTLHKRVETLKTSLNEIEQQSIQQLEEAESQSLKIKDDLEKIDQFIQQLEERKRKDETK